MPTVEGIGRDAALLYEAESEEVVVARDTFASVRQYVISLQEEVRSPFRIEGMAQILQQTATGRYPRVVRHSHKWTGLHGSLSLYSKTTLNLRGMRERPPGALGPPSGAECCCCTRCNACGGQFTLQALVVASGLGLGVQRSRSLRRLKSPVRSSSNLSRMSTVHLIQQVTHPPVPPYSIDLQDACFPPLLGRKGPPICAGPLFSCVGFAFPFIFSEGGAVRPLKMRLLCTGPRCCVVRKGQGV